MEFHPSFFRKLNLPLPLGKALGLIQAGMSGRVLECSLSL